MKKLKTKYMAMMVMVLGIATVSFFACRFTKENKDSNIYGVDLSHYNCLEDWDQATADIKMDLIPVIDIERQTKGYEVSSNELRKRVRVFVNLCKKHYGKTPIIYCSQPFYTKNFLGYFNDCQYWCGSVNAPVMLPHAIHQKTMKKVAGIKGKVDYNILNCKLKEIQL